MFHSLLLLTVAVSVVVSTPISNDLVERQTPATCTTAQTLCCFVQKREHKINGHGGWDANNQNGGHGFGHGAFQGHDRHWSRAPHQVSNCYPATDAQTCYNGNNVTGQPAAGLVGEIFCCNSYDTSGTVPVGDQCESQKHFRHLMPKDVEGQLSEIQSPEDFQG